MKLLHEGNYMGGIVSMRGGATLKMDVGGEPHRLVIDNVRPATKAAVKKGSAEIVADVVFEREPHVDRNLNDGSFIEGEVFYRGELIDNNLTVPGVGVQGLDPYSFVCFGNEKTGRYWLLELYQDTMAAFLYEIDVGECPDGNGAI